MVLGRTKKGSGGPSEDDSGAGGEEFAAATNTAVDSERRNKKGIFGTKKKGQRLGDDDGTGAAPRLIMGSIYECD